MLFSSGSLIVEFSLYYHVTDADMARLAAILLGNVYVPYSDQTVQALQGALYNKMMETAEQRMKDPNSLWSREINTYEIKWTDFVLHNLCMYAFT